ncbi:unnamed protein product [Prunus brigantina]
MSSCPNLTALPELFEDLDSLRFVTMHDCPNLKLLPPDFKLLTKLQHLYIQECPELDERCRHDSNEDWSKIAHVPHKYIGSPQLRQFGETSTSGSSSVQASSQRAAWVGCLGEGDSGHTRRMGWWSNISNVVEDTRWLVVDMYVTDVL